VHALRNAMVPVITSIGYNFGYVLAGSALVETVFAWPGLGRLLYDSMTARDTPVILESFSWQRHGDSRQPCHGPGIWLVDPRIRRR